LAERILLIGMMGAGKTTVGRLLAERLGWRYLDSDEQVEAMTGMTVRDIFEAEGEAAFRAYETAALAAALDSDGDAVVSVAGGAVLAAENRERLAGAGTVVWLRADPAVLAGRVGGADHRPLLADDPAGALTRLDAQRRPLYGRLADVTVDVDEVGPLEAAERILAAVGR
jgi:shikimate kinase